MCVWGGGYVDGEPCADALFLSEFKILGVSNHYRVNG